MGVQGNSVKDKRAGIITNKPIFYDVFRCSDGAKVRNGVSAKSAAKFAGVSENFVIMTSIKPARNQYGHLATMSGYYFTRHDGDPVEYAPPRDSGIVPGRPMVYKIDPEALHGFITELGYETATEFCARNNISYTTLMSHDTRGINVRPSTSQFAIKLCKTLGVHMMDIYRMRFVIDKK